MNVYIKQAVTEDNLQLSKVCFVAIQPGIKMQSQAILFTPLVLSGAELFCFEGKEM